MDVAEPLAAAVAAVGDVAALLLVAAVALVADAFLSP